MLTSEFCKRCENLATHYRHQLSLQGYDPLKADDLACFLKVNVYEPSHLLSGKDLEKALTSRKWYAVAVPDTPPIVIVHPLQPILERETSIMHELAHLILGHKPERLEAISQRFASRNYPKQEETEADYLAVCLQLPLVAVLYVQQLGLNLEKICYLYQLSESQVIQRLAYRLNS